VCGLDGCEQHLTLPSAVTQENAAVDAWEAAEQMVAPAAIVAHNALQRSGGGDPAMLPGRTAPKRRTGTASAGDGSSEFTLGKTDSESGRLILSARRTLPTAEAYLRAFHQHPDGPTLRGYAGQLLEWRDNRYAVVDDDALRARLHPWLHRSLRVIHDRRTGAPALADFEANPATVNQALESIRNLAHLDASLSPPCWLGARPDLPPASEVLSFRSGNLHINTGRIFAPTPALFTTSALDFDYDGSAPAPRRFLAFLDQQWGDDPESIALLQEWWGYCLTPDTRQQKILLDVGPKRSGKGTRARLLTRLVGAANVVAPTTSSLAGAFGLQPLIGKSLATVTDARFGGEHLSTVVERLLSISGEDAISIDRKFLGSVTLDRKSVV
jgi:putative DNA primase/helicase